MTSAGGGGGPIGRIMGPSRHPMQALYSPACNFPPAFSLGTFFNIYSWKIEAVRWVLRWVGTRWDAAKHGKGNHASSAGTCMRTSLPTRLLLINPSVNTTTHWISCKPASGCLICYHFVLYARQGQGRSDNIPTSPTQFQIIPLTELLAVTATALRDKMASICTNFLA